MNKFSTYVPKVNDTIRCLTQRSSFHWLRRIELKEHDYNVEENTANHSEKATRNLKDLLIETLKNVHF